MLIPMNFHLCWYCNLNLWILDVLTICISEINISRNNIYFANIEECRLYTQTISECFIVWSNRRKSFTLKNSLDDTMKIRPNGIPKRKTSFLLILMTLIYLQTHFYLKINDTADAVLQRIWEKKCGVIHRPA